MLCPVLPRLFKSSSESASKLHLGTKLAFVSALPCVLGAFRADLPDPRASEQRFSIAWTPYDGLNALGLYV